MNTRTETMKKTIAPTHYGKGSVFRYDNGFIFSDDWSKKPEPDYLSKSSKSRYRKKERLEIEV
jgi:hypothetical protein